MIVVNTLKFQQINLVLQSRYASKATDGMGNGVD